MSTLRPSPFLCHHTRCQTAFVVTQMIVRSSVSPHTSFDGVCGDTDREAHVIELAELT